MLATRERAVLWEVGVHYRHVREGHEPRWAVLTYRWKHRPSGTQGRGRVEVLEGAAGLVRLLLRWNVIGGGTWEYGL